VFPKALGFPNADTRTDDVVFPNGLGCPKAVAVVDGFPSPLGFPKADVCESGPEVIWLLGREGWPKAVTELEEAKLVNPEDCDEANACGTTWEDAETSSELRGVGASCMLSCARVDTSLKSGIWFHTLTSAGNEGSDSSSFHRLSTPSVV
jgi:hypothetical protein